MLKNQLLNLLKGLGNLSLSGDVENIKVLSDITISDKENSIFIIGTGLNENDEEVENDTFRIDLRNVEYIDTFCGNIEIHTTDNKLILIEEF